MDKSYRPESIEDRWYTLWDQAGCFRPAGTGEPYCILLPPPNVTGTLHMGHAFQHTLMDCLIRRAHMQGRNTLWQVGTDHAGIATEMVVGRQLETEGAGRDQLGRDAFIDRVWRWKAESGSTITNQMRRLGVAADWSRERFTMDAALSEAVLETFVRLYEEGLIYRGPRLVNWDPVLKTAISDLEVISEEEQGRLWTIRYPLADGGVLQVATTRPETMLGDTAVAVNPDDARFRQFIGKRARLPLADREIPVIADAWVDPEFGTGCVKITPAHDFNDWEIGQRHGLESINIFTPDARLNDNAPKKYRGLDRFEARKRILADLDQAGLLAEAKPHRLTVPRGDRSGQIIEPYLTAQWFVKMDGFARRALELVEKGEVRFVPSNWVNTYRHWLENIQDWCISRQLWWGHRIPAWYDEQDNIYVGRNEEEVRQKHASRLDRDTTLRRDEDVLETWFSSALWAHSTLGWPDRERMRAEGFDTWLPSSVLVTGFDIIFFWVARMIMMTDHFTGLVPFHDVYITGLVRDKDGQKMSKSKGNILDPLDLIDGVDADSLIEKRTRALLQPETAKRIEFATREEFPDGIPSFGADALRFTFASLASHGRDIKFDISRCEGYRNFLNKLWNAARFVVMNAGDAPAPAEAQPDMPARWIRSRLNSIVTEVDRHLDGYRFDLAAGALYDFVWHEYCDWYLELAKPALDDGADTEQRAATIKTLIHVLEAVLRLLHPFIPFVTEEIWQQIRKPAGIQEDFLIRTDWPAGGAVDPEAEAEMKWLKQVVSAVRSMRTELQLAPGRLLPLKVQQGDDQDRARLERYRELIRRLARIESIEPVVDTADTAGCAIALSGRMRLMIPLTGLVDVGAELERLNKQLDRERKGLEQSRKKLADERFLGNAPEAVIRRERERQEEHAARLARIEEQIDRLDSLREKKGVKD